MTAKIDVPERVFEGILEVQKKGVTNMFDVTNVISTAKKIGYPETAEWVQKNEGNYSKVIILGEEVVNKI